MWARLLTSRQQWPSVIFALTLLAFALIWGIATMVSAPWCDAGESGAVCFRNWVNAAGSSVALIFGSFAILMSVQRRAGPQRRVSADAAPVLLGERRAVLYDLKLVAAGAQQHAAALREGVDALLRQAGGPDGAAALRQRFSGLYHAWPRHDAAIAAAVEAAKLAGADARNLAIRLSRLSTDIAAALAFLTEFAERDPPDNSRGSAYEPALAHLNEVLKTVEPKLELLLRDAETLVAGG